MHTTNELKENEHHNAFAVQPVHQDDADSEEGDGDGEEIGCGYAVLHYLGLVCVTHRHIRWYGAVGQVSSPTSFDEGVGVVAIKHHTLREVTLPERTDALNDLIQEKNTHVYAALDVRPSYRACEELKPGESVGTRAIKRRRRRVDSLREDQEHSIDDDEEEVEEQEGPDKQEVGEHPGSETSAQPLHGWVPQLEGAEDVEAAELAVTPSLRGREAHVREWPANKDGSSCSTPLGLTLQT